MTVVTINNDKQNTHQAHSNDQQKICNIKKKKFLQIARITLSIWDPRASTFISVFNSRENGKNK